MEWLALFDIIQEGYTIPLPSDVVVGITANRWVKNDVNVQDTGFIVRIGPMTEWNIDIQEDE